MIFAATGVTDGSIVPGARRDGEWLETETILMRSKTGSVRRMHLPPAQPVTDAPQARRPVDVAFLVVWMVVWTAAILVALWNLGGAALAGELGAGALPGGLARRRGLRALVGRRGSWRLLLGRAPAAGRRRWRDGIEWADGCATPPCSAPPDRIGRARRVGERRALQHSSAARIRSAGRSSWCSPTGSYVVNDTLMKIATEGLPPYQVLILRGLAAVAWGLPLVLALAATAGSCADVRAAGGGRGTWRDRGDPLLRRGAGATCRSPT